MFRGRYGVDALNRTLVIAACAVSLLSAIFFGGTPFGMAFSGLTLVILILAFYRMFSKNFTARQSELYRYSAFTSKIRAFFLKKKTHAKVRHEEAKNGFVVLTCPNCKQNLRVPKGKGRLHVTCTKCHTKFDGIS